VPTSIDYVRRAQQCEHDLVLTETSCTRPVQRWKIFVTECLLQEHAITSDEILVMDELPERAVIVGAGYIALEFAGILNGYGVDTHVMFRGDKPLRGCAVLPPSPCMSFVKFLKIFCCLNIDYQSNKFSGINTQNNCRLKMTLSYKQKTKHGTRLLYTQTIFVTDTIYESGLASL